MQQQKGIILIMVLTLLLALTVLGVSSMSSSTLQIRMANNFQDRNSAFQAAESALREGERLIESSNFTLTNFDNLCTGGLCLCTSDTGGTCDYSGDSTLSFWEYDVIWNTSTLHKTYATASLGLAEPAKYIIEYLGESCPDSDSTCNVDDGIFPTNYRVTAIGYGTKISAKVMLQSTYKK